MTSLILPLLFFDITGVFGQWATFHTGFPIRFEDIFFTDTHYGWAVGESGTIIHTTDGGETWEKQDAGVDTIDLVNLQFLNRDIGYVVGDWGTFLSTKDGGTTWKKEQTNVLNLLTDLCFIDEKTGWVCGAVNYHWEDIFGIIMQTTDGGVTWEIQKETSFERWDSTHSEEELPDLFYGIHFISSKTGLALGMGSRDNFGPCDIYRTIDGGKHWSLLNQPNDNCFHMAVSPVESNIYSNAIFSIWLSGFGFETSSDGGVHWDFPGPQPLDFVVDMAFVDARTGWMMGNNFYGPGDLRHDWKVCFSDVHGDLFFELDLPDDFFMEGMSNIGKDHVWVIGYSGVVYRWINPEMKTPPSFELLQNFPNPFNALTRIHFRMEQAGFVRMDVFDARGRLAATLAGSEYPAGLHEVKFDAGSSASGIYFCRLEIGGSIFIRKMVLCR